MEWYFKFSVGLARSATCTIHISYPPPFTLFTLFTTFTLLARFALFALFTLALLTLCTLSALCIRFSTIYTNTIYTICTIYTIDSRTVSAKTVGTQASEWAGTFEIGRSDTKADTKSTIRTNLTKKPRRKTDKNIP